MATQEEFQQRNTGRGNTYGSGGSHGGSGGGGSYTTNNTTYVTASRDGSSSHYVDHNNRTFQAMRSRHQLSCLYTKHKTQKRKVWNDGRLVIMGTRAVLHDANPLPGSSDPSLDECEISQNQSQSIVQNPSGQSLETDRFLIDIDGPWVTPTSSSATTTTAAAGRPKTARSSSMKKLFGKKFQKPTTSYVPPPQSINHRRVQAILGKRRRTLQPGELVAMHYGSSFPGGAGGPGCGGNTINSNSTSMDNMNTIVGQQQRHTSPHEDFYHNRQPHQHSTVHDHQMNRSYPTTNGSTTVHTQNTGGFGGSPNGHGQHMNHPTSSFETNVNMEQQNHDPRSHGHSQQPAPYDDHQHSDGWTSEHGRPTYNPMSQQQQQLQQPQKRQPHHQPNEFTISTSANTHGHDHHPHNQPHDRSYGHQPGPRPQKSYDNLFVQNDDSAGDFYGMDDEEGENVEDSSQEGIESDARHGTSTTSRSTTPHSLSSQTGLTRSNKTSIQLTAKTTQNDSDSSDEDSEDSDDDETDCGSKPKSFQISVGNISSSRGGTASTATGNHLLAMFGARPSHSIRGQNSTGGTQDGQHKSGKENSVNDEDGEPNRTNADPSRSKNKAAVDETDANKSSESGSGANPGGFCMPAAASSSEEESSSDESIDEE